MESKVAEKGRGKYSLQQIENWFGAASKIIAAEMKASLMEQDGDLYERADLGMTAIASEVNLHLSPVEGEVIIPTTQARHVANKYGLVLAGVAVSREGATIIEYDQPDFYPLMRANGW